MRTKINKEEYLYGVLQEEIFEILEEIEEKGYSGEGFVREMIDFIAVIEMINENSDIDVKELPKKVIYMSEGKKVIYNKETEKNIKKNFSKLGISISKKSRFEDSKSVSKIITNLKSLFVELEALSKEKKYKIKENAFYDDEKIQLKKDKVEKYILVSIEKGLIKKTTRKRTKSRDNNINK